jgi:magnesium transporter
LLKERFRQRDLWGVLIAVGGVVTLVLSSKESEVRLGPSDIWGAITRWEFELYLGLTVTAIVALMWASERYGEKTLLIDLGLVGLFGKYHLFKN